MKEGAYCPATNARCDRPCALNECQRVKLDDGSFRVNGGLMQDVPRPPPPDLKPVISPAQIRCARAYLDLTVAELAEAADMSKTALGMFERGHTIPHEKTLRKLVGALWDQGLEIFGTADTYSGIRDFWSKEQRAKHGQPRIPAPHL